MLFNSPVYFLLFLPLVAVVYFQLARIKKIDFAIPWLTIASLFFYGYWNWRYLPLLLFTLSVNYGFVLLMRFEGRLPPRFASWQGNWRRAVLWAGILFNVGLLGYFKYADFFLTNLNAVMGAQLPLIHVVLPLGISFFTFQKIAYLVDCYRGDVKEFRFKRYALFVSFFPQLIAGPIVHHKEMMPQFGKDSRINWDNVATGFAIFVMGLFKKVVIADSFSIWANHGFDKITSPSFVDAWIATASYTLQIYYDFSGYSDMAIGAALIFNIRLPVNFNSPYQASSVREFWTRWHMTLSRWLRDYIYIPLGGNRSGQLRTFLSVFATFLLGGLWHGAAWTFVIWGALHGVAVCIERAWTEASLVKMPRAVKWALTLGFVQVTWVFFRATSLQKAWTMLAGMMGMNGYNSTSQFASSLSHINLWIIGGLSGIDSHQVTKMEPVVMIAVFALAALVAPNSLEICGYLDGKSPMKVRASWRWMIAISVTLSVALGVSILGRQKEFLYFQF